MILNIQTIDITQHNCGNKTISWYLFDIFANLILTARPSRLATLKKEVVAEGTQNKGDLVVTSYKWDASFF